MTALRIPCLLLALLVSFTGAARAEPTEDEDWPLADRLLDRFAAGRYEDVVRLAPGVLAQEPRNDELRRALADSLLWTGHAWAASGQYLALIETGSPEMAAGGRLRLADALAWTGRMPQSLPYYTAQLDGPDANQARLGRANAERWMGRHDLALPDYRKALAARPDDEAAQLGALYSDRELRPRTELVAGIVRDNTPMRRDEALLRHTWRNDAGTRIYAVDTNADRDEGSGVSLRQRETGFHVEDLALPLAPRLDLADQGAPDRRLFGQLRLQVAEAPLYVNYGMVNWGKLVFNAPALKEGLIAHRAGLEGKLPTAAGEFRGFIDRYTVSDGNRVDNADVRLTPWWRPWGPDIRPYAGIAWRSADRSVADYWSPRRYGVGYAGLEGEWQRRDWSFFAFGHVGVPLSGEAANYWGTGLSAKRWLSGDWAVAATAWAQSNARGANYRAHGLNFTLEKLW